MLARIIDFHLHHRFFVLSGLVGLIGLGLYAAWQLPMDAFPDLTNNQVIVVTEAPGMAPGEVEQLVTFPLESALMGLPGAQEVRSLTKLGLSMITVVFDDWVNVYFARQLVNERLVEARSRIPEGLEPTLGPVATAFGEIYQYTIEGGGLSARELKTLHEWQIKYQLRAVPGVGEINTWGGLTQQYEVVVDPDRLQSYGMSLRQLFERIRENNENFGAGSIVHGAEQYTVRGLGRVERIDDLNSIVLTSYQGNPVFLRDVAEVKVGSLPRQGAVTRDGKGETVSGMIIMLKGANGKTVNEAVKEKLAQIVRTLPEGVRILPFYDQSEVIDRTSRTVRRNLLEGGVLVVVVLLAFLGNIRAALLVAAVIPLSMLIGFIGMWVFGVSANLMSLGAIDFGLIVDGSIVMMENFMRRLQSRESTPLAPFGEIRAGAHEVARPVVFGVGIIIAVYLPIFALQGLEGRMFRPMAITVCSAILGSLVIALTVIPAAATVAFGKPLPPHRERWFGRFRDLYVQGLDRILDRRLIVVILAVLLVAAAFASLVFIGTEFMPRLDEGSLLIETRKLQSVSVEESVAISTQIEKIILGFPEVEAVVTKIGRPDLATEAMGVYQGDVYVRLKPREQWTTAHDLPGLIEAFDRQLRYFPGVSYNFTQPMAMRLDEVVSGVKADVAVKIFGEDDETLMRKASEVLRIIGRVPGAADVQMETLTGSVEWRVIPKRDELARYGLNVSALQELITTAVNGVQVSEFVEGQKRFGIVVRLPERIRQSRDALLGLRLVAPGGEQLELGRVAEVVTVSSPEVISRENAQRRIVVQSNVRGRDLGSFVDEARGLVETSVELPPGYFIEWGGQFENQQRAMQRLAVVVPVAILIIFGLLFASFDSVKQALLVLMNVPFAAVGGIAALWLRGINLNLSASVGFIAVFGVAVLNGVVLVTQFNRFTEEGMPVRKAIVRGSAIRLRPVLMTALVASLGFLPMATATSAGAEVQRPLATVVIGGLITSTLLTLVLVPILYSLCCERRTAGAETEL